MSAVRVVVHPDAETLAEVTAARLAVHLVDLQSIRRPVHLVLTGGGVGTAVLAALAAAPAARAVDWSGVHLWWGDERYLPAGHPDRNDTGAWPLLAAVPVPETQVHRVPGPDLVGSAEEAADRYGAELAGQGDGASTPAFDLVLLGVGPDGHVASVFPGQQALDVTDRAVVAVPEAPKPPPVRVSLTLPVLAGAAEVWYLLAGAEKATALAGALQGDPRLPVGRLRGRRRTLALVDLAAAGGGTSLG